MLNRSKLQDPFLETFKCFITDIKSNPNIDSEAFLTVRDRLGSDEYRTRTEKTICSLPSNTSKNRLGGILPHDHLILSSDGSIHGTQPVNYLNGNRIAVPSFSNHCHIAAQGPLKETIQDFFNVVIEANTSIIVAIVMHKETKWVDGDQIEFEKCSDYWERSADLGNGFFLKPGKEVERFRFIGTTEGFLVREIDILKKGEPFRSIHQYHYQNWPDFGAPDPLVFNQFHKQINAQIKRDEDLLKIQGPLAVHCSAGCGRTGTYLATRIIQEFVESELNNGKLLDQIEINIPQLVFEMNLCRRLIETPVQYHAVLVWTQQYVAHLAAQS